MGAQPKKKISTHKKGKRRRNINLTTKQLTKCVACNQPKETHLTCSHCGAYKS